MRISTGVALRRRKASIQLIRTTIKIFLKKKKAKPQKAFKTEQQVKVIGYNGEELTKEEAEQKIGTVFEGIDGKRYCYTRTLASSVKTEIDITLHEIQYYKLEYEPVDEQGNAVAVSQRQTAVCAKTDYLKKTQVSVSLMSFVLYLWIGLKDPVYRIANALYEYGVNLSKQQIYKDIYITVCLLMPIFKHMESYIRLEKQIGIDETYHSTRERRLLTKSPPDDRTKSKKHKSQKSKAKTLRTYFYAVIGGKYVCLYYHDPYRDSDIPKEILKKTAWQRMHLSPQMASIRYCLTLKMLKEMRQKSCFSIESVGFMLSDTIVFC